MSTKIVTGNAGGGSGGIASVPDELIFPDAITRDDYFSTNPSKLKKDIYVTVGGTLQKYDGDQFINVSAIIRGEPGADAPGLLIQYSATGNSGWTTNLNLAIHKYWRWSTDGGLSWSADFVKFSGEGGSGVPEPYSMIVGSNGKLQLYKDGELIQEQDETGAWIATSVSTGTGSLHLGDLHSVGSGGENVIFLNTDSTIAWYPGWGGVSVDGTQALDISARIHGELSFAEPIGEPLTSGSVPYVDNFEASSDVVFFYGEVIPAETFSGRLRWIANKSTGKEVAAFYFDAVLVEGQRAIVPFKYPLWVKSGQSFSIEITKDNGDLLQVRGGSLQPTKPYRKTYYRTFTDYNVFHQGNVADLSSELSSLAGNDRISANAIKDFPIADASNIGMVKIGATMTVNGEGEINSAISPTSIKIVSDEAARLLIPGSSGAILAIQQDNGFTYGIEANQDTSVVGNWKQIGVVATSVVSFNGRSGAVVPETGDYNQKQIKTIHDDTGAEGWFGIDNTGIYWETP